MPDSQTLARGRFMKADSDLAAARRILDSEGPYDTVCFHAQQAVEKLLKGLLAFKEQLFPRTHNLEELLQLCIGFGPKLSVSESDLTSPTPYAIEVRYDFEF